MKPIWWDYILNYNEHWEYVITQNSLQWNLHKLLVSKV